MESSAASRTHTHLRLRGTDRLRYFGPSLFVLYLVLLCFGLTVLSSAFVTLPNPGALIATGLFGIFVTGGLCILVFRIQSGDLRYRIVTTAHSADDNYAAVLQVVRAAGWKITRTKRGLRIEAEVSGTLLSRGEMLSILFDGPLVKLVGICDPQVGFSLAGRRRCRHHLARITGVLATDSP